MAEAGSGGGAQGPSNTGERDEIVAKVLSLVASIAMDAEGRESDGMRAIEGLRREKDREAVIRDLVSSFRAPVADPELWLKWLAGGGDPFVPQKASKPTMGKHSSGRELDRSSTRITKLRARVEAVRRDLTSAEAALAREVEHEAAIITWAILEKMAEQVLPLFAMGPAWTLMRVVGPYVDVDEMEEELILETDGRVREAIAQRVRSDRVELSARLHRALDLWAGDAEFEIAVREAIREVVKRFEPRENEAREKGRKLRSRDEMKKSVRPDPASPRQSVLGLSDAVD